MESPGHFLASRPIQEDGVCGIESSCDVSECDRMTAAVQRDRQSWGPPHGRTSDIGKYLLGGPWRLGGEDAGSGLVRIELVRAPINTCKRITNRGCVASVEELLCHPECSLSSYPRLRTGESEHGFLAQRTCTTSFKVGINFTEVTGPCEIRCV